MATVFLARDLRHGRPVAIKVLRPEIAAALGPERFLREIEVAARLTHPHILPLHESGEAAGSGEDAWTTFSRLRALAAERAGLAAATRGIELPPPERPIPARLTEPWFC